MHTLLYVPFLHHLKRPSNSTSPGKTGKDWSDPVILERLRRAIVAQKDDYWKPTNKRSLQYTKGYSVFGYLAYHFPVYFMQTRHLLASSPERVC